MLVWIAYMFKSIVLTGYQLLLQGNNTLKCMPTPLKIQFMVAYTPFDCVDGVFLFPHAFFFQFSPNKTSLSVLGCSKLAPAEVCI